MGFKAGHIYRKAAARPRHLIVLLGMWLLFGMMALTGALLLFLGGENALLSRIWGAFFLLVSVRILWRTTRNYRAR